MNRTHTRRKPIDSVFLAILTVAALVLLVPGSSSAESYDHGIKFASGEVTPSPITGIPTAVASARGHILIQFDQPLTEIDKDRLSDAGVILLDYVPNLTYTARLTRSLTEKDLAKFGIRWVGALSSRQKLSPQLVQTGIPDWARRGGDSVQVTVALYRDELMAPLIDRLTHDFGARVLGSQNITNAMEVILPEGEIDAVLALDAVMYVEPALPPWVEFNNSCRAVVGADSVQAPPISLNGSGVVVGLWDGGRADGTHPDFGGRVSSADASSLTAHATHVAGTILGSGSQSSGLYRGMAPSATMSTRLWWNSASDMVTQYTDAIFNYGVEISNNSWGVGVPTPVQNSTCTATLGNYFVEDATIDNIVRGAAVRPIVIVWSAGNNRSTGSQYCGSIGWVYNTIDPLAASKNVIAVGAVNSNDRSGTTFSSWGPTDDGRIKPDVVAPGCQIGDDNGVTSTKIGGGYAVQCGTSMAAPVVTGVIALMKQRWNQLLSPDTLYPSTIRGILTNTATDLGRVGPDFENGWGLVDAVKAVKKIGEGRPSYAQASVTTGVVHDYALSVPPGVSTLKVTLAWDDVGGTSVSGSALINDLDLVLIDPSSGQTLPWILTPAFPLTPAGQGTDHRNNIEAVEVNNPVSGNWIARVTGYNIATGPQKYSIVFSPDSINTTAIVRSVDAHKERDTLADPGIGLVVGFRAKNTGGGYDSVRVRITDSLAWLNVTVDTMIGLGVFDSSRITALVTPPLESTPATVDRVRVVVNSKSDTTATDSASELVTIRTVYGLAFNAIAPDTLSSPESHSVNAWLHNTGNVANLAHLTAVNDSGWSILPGTIDTNMLAGDSSLVTFTLYVPAEVPDHAVSHTSLSASGSGGSSATKFETEVITNSLLPPKLIEPDTVAFQRDGTPEFIWSSAGSQYRLIIAADSLLVTPTRQYSVAADTSWNLPQADSLPDGAYYWGVKTYAGSDSSSIQRHPRRLSIDNLPPSAASPVSPVGSYPNHNHFEFVTSTGAPVNPVTAPEFNKIEFSADSAFGAGASVFSPILTDSLVMPDSVSDGRWYWRARREDKAGNVTPYSSTASFVLDTKAPPRPVLVRPSDNVTVGGSPTLLFSWIPTPAESHAVSPNFYRLQVSTDSAFAGGFLLDSVSARDSVSILRTALVLGSRYFWRVQALDSAGWSSDESPANRFLSGSYTCGDMDSSDAPDIADLTILIGYLFLNGQPPAPPGTGSVDCEEGIDISDITWLIAYLYLDGPPLCCF